MVNFILRETFGGNLNEAVSTNEVALFRFPGKIFLKVRLSASKNFFYYLHRRKPFKNDEKCFLFHFKSSFRSQDILIFVLTF